MTQRGDLSPGSESPLRAITSHLDRDISTGNGETVATEGDVVPDCPVMPRKFSGASGSNSSNTPSVSYDVSDAYKRNVDNAFEHSPVQGRGEGPIRRHISREDHHAAGEEPPATDAPNSPAGRRLSQVSSRRDSLRQRRQSATRVDYNVPDAYVNAPDVFSAGPVQNPEETGLYKHTSLEDSRSQDQEYLKEQREQRRASRTGSGAPPPQPVEEKPKDGDAPQHHVSSLATQIYTLSYLVLFSIFGTLARLGLQALTNYPGAPIPFSSVWPNFGGSLVMGFLSEDRMLFRYEWGTPVYEQEIEKARQRQKDVESGGSGSDPADDGGINLAAAKKKHMATKKTIPLYIGLATGFCGSFTSFSSFIRDVFLALSNDLPTPELGNATMPRNGGYSVMAVLAVVITTVALSLAGLFVGAHLAIALEPVMPSLPFVFTRKVLDRVAVFLAVGCWIGAVVLSAVPPDRFSHGLGSAETWRGRATFALVFAPLGCLARFYASLFLNGKIASFPLGTFAVNMFGTAVLGMAWDLAHVPEGGVIGCQVLQGIEDGFCGCLTTVSTWVAELAALRRRHSYTYGFASVAAALCLMVAIMGGLRWSQGFAGLVCLK